MQLKLFTADEVAKELGVSVFSIRRWALKGLIPAGRSLGGGKWLFSSKQIQQIQECLTEGVENAQAGKSGN